MSSTVDLLIVENASGSSAEFSPSPFDPDFQPPLWAVQTLTSRLEVGKRRWAGHVTLLVTYAT